MSQITDAPRTPGATTVDTTPSDDAATFAELHELVEDAVALANRWSDATEAGQTKAEKRTSDQLGALLRDEKGLDLAVKFVDRVARPEDNTAAARELARLSSNEATGFMGKLDAKLLGLGSRLATTMPPVVVPAARTRLRQLVGHLVVDASDPTLAKHLAKAHADGFRLNINLLGEAVLGEAEAARRTEETRKLLARDDVDYVSIKVSCLVSQISTWDAEGTVERALERLRPIYRVANGTASDASSPSSNTGDANADAGQPGGGAANVNRGDIKKKFVNLDMEEYRDLDLTIELFTRLLSEPEFHDLEAGIVLQAYLPDAVPALERLIAFAKERKANGGAGIKVRLVKGANLAMERVEAELHDWKQAPYTSKEDVDANYLRFIERATRPDAMEVCRLGVASHNLYDVAMAHLLAEKRGVSEHLDVEMLQGMAPSQARAVKADVGTVLLYTPVVKREDFDVAVSYLIRRLEENAAEQNFLHAMFSHDEGAAERHKYVRDGLVGTGALSAMQDQERRFRESIDAIASTPVGPRRSPERAPIGDFFENTPDSDPALPAVREWAREAVTRQPAPLTSPQLTSREMVDDVVARGVAAQAGWAGRSNAERAALLREAAREIEKRRGDLVTVAAAEGGKTIDQVDPEISEAIDFARYYADRCEELVTGMASDGARFEPHRLTLVTPPWNFPVAIPIGSVLAALASGSAVVIKPAPQTVGCVEVAMEALWAAGIPRDAAQVVRVEEDDNGRALVAHDDVDTVILTGSIETGRLFAGWRARHAGGPRVFGETSGKNALVVTPAADLDLAAADLMKSAFGHAGQKCSAASLGILVGSVATSKRFREQLVDAVKSLRVGWPSDLGTTMGPVIEPPSGKLLKALTTLEPGETWLVEPKQLDDTGRLWSPGLKDGVKPGSFFHMTEVFGPVLGLMHADTLEEALELQNATQFGLTAGIHSLDEDEVTYWQEHVEAGNCYVNRHITGAIVQRQSFGGWKESVIGPGAKAGGPNYVAQLGTWVSDGVARQGAPIMPRVRDLLEILSPLARNEADREWLHASLRSDAFAWREELGIEADPSSLRAESNVFRYRPQPQVVVRAELGETSADGDVDAVADRTLAEVARLVLGAHLVGSSVYLSWDVALQPALTRLAATGEGRQALVWLNRMGSVESSAQFVTWCRERTRDGEPLRIRMVGADADGETAAALASAPGEDQGASITPLFGEVLSTGRRELLTFLREQAISRTLHRFGHVAPELMR